MGAARDFSIASFGGPTVTREASVSIGVGAGELVAGHPDRLELTIVNFGASEIVVKPGRGVTTTNGFRVPSGGTIIWRVDIDGEVLADRFEGISAAAGQTVFVHQLIRIYPEEAA